jgi:hypothetical protein
MNDAEIEAVVGKAVSQTLLKLGIDVDNPLEFQADMQHLRNWRQSVDTVKKQSLMTAIAILTAGVLGLVWMAVRGPSGG